AATGDGGSRGREKDGSVRKWEKMEGAVGVDFAVKDGFYLGEKEVGFRGSGGGLRKMAVPWRFGAKVE
ncbi:UNVERIFIED_CONTAM: hypothetical protein Sradi_1586900, partial [Sesamum radiatum]